MGHRLGSAALSATLLCSMPASAGEPTEPVVVGWWSYFDNTKIQTPSTPEHTITAYGDPDTCYYEPSGGHGLQEDPNILPPAQAWQNIISYIFGKSNNASLPGPRSLAPSPCGRRAARHRLTDDSLARNAATSSSKSSTRCTP